MNHFKYLYSKNPVKNINLDSLFKNTNIPKLSNEEKHSLEENLTNKEMLYSLKRMNNNSAPGSSGFTTSYYKVFWRDIGDFLVRSLNCASGELSASFKQGIITCIPKGDKHKMYLKNWKHISRLNVAYKIASASIAGRLKQVLDSIISEDQSRILPGRFMGDNIRLVYYIMFYTERNNLPGILLLLDFATAFDSISWDLMFKIF